MLSSSILISVISLPAIAADYCQYSDSQAERKNQLANQHQLLIKTIYNKSNNETPENSEVSTISKNGKALYQDLIELCVTKRLDLIAKKNNKIGVINATGQLIIPFIYDSIYPYSETFVVEKDWLFGLIDRQNRPFSAVEYHFDGYTLSQAEHKPLTPLIGYKKFDINDTTTGAWGSIDSSGATIIPFVYDDISTISNLVYEEMTRVYKVQKDDYWGVISDKGNIVLPPLYQKIYWFNAYKKLYLVVKHNQQFITDATQNILIKGDIEHISFIDVKNEQILDIYDYDAHDGKLHPAIIRINNKYGLFDSNANQKLSAEYDELSYLYENDLVSAEKNGVHGVVNVQGEVVIPLKYDQLETVVLETSADQPRELGYFIAKQQQRFGLLSLDNKIILPFDYRSMDYNVFDIPNRIIASRVIENTVNIAEKNKVKFALLTADGKSITPFIYDKVAYDNYDSRIHMWQEGREGLIDKEGQILLEPIYQSLDYDIVEDGYIFKRDGLYGWLIDTGYKEIIPAMYDESFKFEEGVATVIKDGITMSINKRGKVIKQSK